MFYHGEEVGFVVGFGSSKNVNRDIIINVKEVHNLINNDNDLVKTHELVSVVLGVT